MNKGSKKKKKKRKKKKKKKKENIISYGFPRMSPGGIPWPLVKKGKLMGKKSEK